jgi:hypothetical protein
MTGGRRAILVLALEAAFGNGVPQIGQQIVFTRIRVTAGVPENGNYTVTHPYGKETFPNVTSSGGNRDIVFTEDVGIAPGVFTEALSSRVGPFLRAADSPGGSPKQLVTLNGAQFLSDGATPEFVTGSPFDTNYFEICGSRDDGTAIDLNGPADGACTRTDLFALAGKVHDLIANPIGSPLRINRATYSRDAATGNTFIDVSATAGKGIGQPDPKLAVGAADIPPVLMNGPTPAGDFYAQAIPVPPNSVASQVTVTNFGDLVPTSLAGRISDDVTVSAANYNSGARTLTVTATSSDKGYAGDSIPPPTLALEGFPSATVAHPGGDPAATTFTAGLVTVPPASVLVASDRGGRGRADVAMGISAAPFPAGVPFTQNDEANAVGGGDAIIIPVLANDVAPDGASINPASVTILAPGLNPPIGSTSVNTDGTISFTPTQVTGTAVLKYTVGNTVGTSNVATVTVNVGEPAGGFTPIATPDGINPAINVIAGTSVAIDVLANDSGNGGTLDPASVTVLADSVTGGAIGSVNTTTGAVTYTAGAAAGTFGFDYTVANTNGNLSAPAHVTVNVVTPEALGVTQVTCKAQKGEWDVRGTSSVSTNNTITLYNTSPAPLNPVSSDIVGTSAVAAGVWRVSVRGVPCASPVSIRSSLGTVMNGIAVTIR